MVLKFQPWSVLACVAAGLALTACNSGGESSTGGSANSGEDTITVGFSQIGAESDWRRANTESIQSEADARDNIELKFSDGQQKQENQIRAVRNFIAQGVDVIILAPVVETGWEPVLKEAKDAEIPVIVSDRRPDVPEDYYVTFIGSDFVEEGRRAARFLAEKMDGKAVIAELSGTPGSAPANDRAAGFQEVLADNPDMKVIFSQTGDFTRAKGKEVMEALLKSPQGKQINALYAHNDDMALGAIQAIEEAGLKPGEDIIIVSIDGVKAAFEAMAAGKLNCTVECNPLLGPQLFDAVEKIIAGESVPKRIETEEGVFTQEQAAEELPKRKY